MLPDSLPVPPVVRPCTHEVTVGEKCYECDAYAYAPWLGGATTFDAAEQYGRGSMAAAAVAGYQRIFSGIIANIMSQDPSTMALSTKASLVIQAAQDMQARLGADPIVAGTAPVELGEAERKGGPIAAIKQLFGGGRPEPGANGTPVAPPPAAPPPPAPTITGGFKVLGKDPATGRDRWLAVYSNDVKDRDGERFPLERHAEMVEWVDGTKDYPELWLWHTPGTRMGEADMIDLSTEGFMIATGTFDAGMEQEASNLRAMGALGVSHGYVYASKQQGEFGPYRTFEISPLPASRAANPYTGFLADPTEDLIMLTPDKKDFLSAVIGAGPASVLEQQLATAASAMKAQGKSVGWKELLDGFKEDDAPPPVVAAAPAPADGSAPLTLEALQAAMTAAIAPLSEQIGTLSTGLATVQTEVKELSKSDDERMAARFMPRGSVAAGFSPLAGAGADPSGAGMKEAAAVLPAGEEAANIPPHLRSHLAMISGRGA